MKKICALVMMVVLSTLLVSCGVSSTEGETKEIETKNLEKVYTQYVGHDWTVGKFIEKDTGNIIYIMDGYESGAMVVIQK